MLYSFLSHNPGQHSVYLLSQEDPARFRDIGRLCELAGSAFTLLDPRASVRRMRGASNTINNEKSMAMYHRIYAGHLLPPELSKVLYLDADLLVRRSIEKLWNMDLADYYLAASAMSGSMKKPDFVAKFGGRYFNSGVMLINLDRWRADDVAGGCERVLAERPEDIIYWDQCLLNFTCRPWLEIGIRYNFYYGVGERWANRLFGLSRREFRDIAAHPAIIHFVGENKPWKRDPSALYELEREYPVYRQAFEQALTEQRWTGPIIPSAAGRSSASREEGAGTSEAKRSCTRH